MREPPKTYWHLAGARRMPTDYEVATSKLHYYVGRGFEMAVPRRRRRLAPGVGAGAGRPGGVR